MIKIHCLKIGLFLLILIGCQHDGNKNDKNVGIFSEKVNEAKGFRISDSLSMQYITVLNPWQNATNTSYTYILNTDSINREGTIHIPVKRAICLSTTHIGYIDELGESGSIVGLSNPGLVNNTALQKAIKAGSIADVGYDAALNFELIINLKPDVVFAYSVGPEMVPLQAKLNEFGIPLIMVAEYLEQTPMAKTEWIKFFGSFYNKFTMAEAFYQAEKNRYDSVKQLVDTSLLKPKIMTGFPWKDVWYVPGNESYMVKLIEDAGGEYLFNEAKGRESQPFAVEYICQRAAGANIWINAGVASSKTDIALSDERLLNLSPFKNNRVYNSNQRQTPDGGNDFFESGVVYPHLILSDLIAIFNADSLTNNNLHYYQKLQ